MFRPAPLLTPVGAGLNVHSVLDLNRKSQSSLEGWLFRYK